VGHSAVHQLRRFGDVTTSSAAKRKCRARCALHRGTIAHPRPKLPINSKSENLHTTSSRRADARTRVLACGLLGDARLFYRQFCAAYCSKVRHSLTTIRPDQRLFATPRTRYIPRTFIVAVIRAVYLRHFTTMAFYDAHTISKEKPSFAQRLRYACRVMRQGLSPHLDMSVIQQSRPVACWSHGRLALLGAGGSPPLAVSAALILSQSSQQGSPGRLWYMSIMASMT
jgi:hypothetical protein